MRSLDDFAKSKLAALKGRDQLRRMVETRREDGLWIEREGRRLLSFCCNDYLNLSHHPKVKASAIAAIERYGAGAGASRLVTGNHPLLGQLEERLASLKGTEAACIFGSGYLANAGIIPVVVGKDGLVLVDELAHSCLWSGTQLSRATTVAFRHNDLTHVEELLGIHRPRHDHALIVTDGIFSMDGDRAPIAELAAIAKRHDTWLMTDDAHGLGIVGGGRGSTAEAQADVPLQMGTLSKALGAYGGYLCASNPVIELMHNRARTLIYSTGLPPAVAAAALAALDVIEQDPDYAALPLAKARAFTRMTNLPEAQSPIVPVVIGDERDALDASRLLSDRGFFVAAIRPPTVPAGTARLRLTFTAQHPDGEIERLADLVRSQFPAR